MKSLLLTRSDPHTFRPASSGAPSLLATGSLRERIPAFSQRQSACEAGSKKVEGGGDLWTVDRPRPFGPKACCSWPDMASGDGRSIKMLQGNALTTL